MHIGAKKSSRDAKKKTVSGTNGHDGSWGGFKTSYYRYLTADRTTVLLSNRGNFDNDKLWTALDGLIERHLSTEE